MKFWVWIIFLFFFPKKTHFLSKNYLLNGNLTILPWKYTISTEKSLYIDVWVSILNTCLDDDPIGIMIIPFRWSFFAQLNGKLKQKNVFWQSRSIFDYFWRFYSIHKFVSWHVRNSYSPLEILDFFFHFVNSGIFRTRNWILRISRLTWFSWFHDFSHFWVKDLI